MTREPEGYFSAEDLVREPDKRCEYGHGMAASERACSYCVLEMLRAASSAVDAAGRAGHTDVVARVRRADGVLVVELEDAPPETAT